MKIEHKFFTKFIKSYKKIAFTLAEVLVTLCIIGVVAAITIPALITAYQKQQTVIVLKKFYTTFNQALKLSEVKTEALMFGHI